ncbi:tetratricopeptide repeat protein [Enhygromyxa salina]|uniref:Tetratricopeptide repeat protein n=1 Tax=Enhygromyxa salina TaxID=215803 RepID=A0A2S9YUZ3_9BACT|nr:hypothetical protein [Enhygromyxa salina]PRQ08903.1 hypothetical protein ENSA7_13930 [Enhygromyxa salina]
MPRRILAILLSIASITWGPSTPAEASPATRSAADTHYDAAAELYAREDYAGAASEFAVAYALAPRVDTLFAWAQAERLAGNYEEALELYERLLAGELSAAQREAIETLRFQVRGELVIAPAEPASEPEPTEPPPTEPATVDDGSTTSARRGGGLIGLGTGLTVLAGGLVISGAVLDRRVSAARTYMDFEAAFDPKTSRGRGAVGLYASGGVLAAAGVAMLVMGVIRLKRSKRPPVAPIALVPALGRDHVGVALTIGGWK